MEKIVRPYEVLVRLGRDGVETAHVIEIEEIVEDGQATFARELPAKPLALASVEFAAIVARIDQTALAERDALKVERDALDKQCVELAAANQRLRENVLRLGEELAGMKSAGLE